MTHVESTGEDVGSDEHPLLKRLELLVSLDPLLLGESRVDGDGGEVALPQQLVQLSGAGDGLDEDDDLGVTRKISRRQRRTAVE